MVCLFLGIGIFRLSSDDSVSIGSSYTIPLTILQLSERPCNEIDELCYALPPLKAMRRCDIEIVIGGGMSRFATVFLQRTSFVMLRRYKGDHRR